MSFLKNAKIKTKVLTLILPLCLAGIGSVLAIAASYRQADTIHSEFIHNDGIASVELARLSTVIVIAGYSANQATLYAATDPEMKAVLEGYKTNSQRIATRFADLNRLMPSMSGELASFQKLASEILTVTDRIVKMGSEGQNESARVLLRTIDPMITQFRNEVRDTVDRMSERLRTETDNMTDTMTRTILTYLGALTVLFCGLIAAALFVSSRGITGPIDALRARMLTLAGGETDMPVPGLDRRDEVGQMADAVAVFRTNALDRIRLEDEASRNRSLSEEQQRREAEADRIRTANMSQATTGLGEGLKHLANGDLTFQLAKPFAPDFETLRTDFNAAVLQLAQTLRAVADATGAIDMGSREVSASADDLSKRTETQAASLEETAAALDQITVNVANSSKRADEARKVAVLANESAAQSGRVVADAGDAMNRIEQSSNEISNIIGVIDEIAFQTNLLALNAGVEAARAGEAGKGFAVVAQEVRELAQRSAKAAKEIKDLIRNSSIAVQSGVKLVSDTGESLKTIEGYIVTVNQHMDSIATSAREQSVGLAEVNTAVNQMDQVTQQNAAMVEETSAAGATLASESGRLRELIAQFQLGNALLQSAPGPAAVPAAQPAGSPARRLAAKVAYAVTGNAALKERWEDF